MTTQQRHNYLVSNIIDKSVKLAMEDQSYSILEALNYVYNSPVIDWLQDESQDLASKSPAYVFELIKRNQKEG